MREASQNGPAPLARKIGHRAMVTIDCIVLVCTLIGTPHSRAQVVGPRTGEGTAVAVADAIRMSKVSSEAGHPETEIAHFSPNGKNFVIVVRKGNLRRNTNDYSLLLWRSDQVFHSPAPTVLLRMSSSSNRPAIQGVTWLADDETLAFLGEHPGESQQLYTFNIRTHVLMKVTNHPSNLLAYSMSLNGQFLAFVAEEPVKSMWDKRSMREGVVISTEYVYQVIAGRKGGRMWGTPQLFYQIHGGRARRIVTEDVADVLGSALRLSPDGHYILFAPRVRIVPEIWKQYTNAWVREQANQTLRAGEWSWLGRYELIDTRTGRTRVLLDSPRRGILSQAVWAADSRSVIVSGVYLPLEGANGDQRRLRESTPFCVEVRVPGGQITEISHEDLELVGWDPKSSSFVFCRHNPDRLGGSCSKIHFRKSGAEWEQIETSLQERGQIAQPDVFLEQDMNTPPRVFARAPGQRQTVLLDLNPQFRRLQFGKEEEIHWKGSKSEDFNGGLYYPVGYTPGKRYPLVIQTHAFRKDRFWIDGPWTTAFAAQPLAGKGMVVLQADESHDDSDSPTEVDREVDRLETAIDFLDGGGLIDRNRIGIIGFSRTCLFVKYALSHSRYKFAAASVTDGVDGGYFQYLLSSYMSDSYEGINGGLPWGTSLQSWRQRSPGFNVDKVRTPLRIMAENSEVALFEWEWYAALSRLGKVVEMVVTMDGEHILQKPWQRMVSQQGNVDWFAFWLKDEEEPDPGKADQYRRWQRLRRQNEMP
jgi:dipeptidyl aminopeptidase/acylaminoacyl peptidase